MAQQVVYTNQQPIGLVEPDYEYDDEEDERANRWHYSRFAIPFLLFCVLLLIVLFILTFWQQTGNIHNQWDGVPRKLVSESLADSDHEGGMNKDIRNVRVGVVFFGILGVVVAFTVFFARPSPKLRIAFCGLAGLLLLLAGILAWIAFGIGMDEYDQARQCPEHRVWTGEACADRSAFAIAALAVDACIGVVAIVGAIQLVYNGKAGHWRVPPRGPREEQNDIRLEEMKRRAPGDYLMRNVAYVRRWLVGINLVGLFALLAACLVLLLVLHEDREVEYVRSYRGRAYSDMNPYAQMPYEHAGWPTRNSRIRYAAVAIGLLTAFFNFMPFTRKTIAIIFGFFYFACGGILLVAFGFDVYELREADKLPCPWTPAGNKIECTKSPFLATAWFDIFTAFCLWAYVILEYLLGCSRVKQEARADREM